MSSEGVIASTYEVFRNLETTSIDAYLAPIHLISMLVGWSITRGIKIRGKLPYLGGFWSLIATECLGDLLQARLAWYQGHTSNIQIELWERKKNQKKDDETRRVACRLILAYLQYFRLL